MPLMEKYSGVSRRCTRCTSTVFTRRIVMDGHASQGEVMRRARQRRCDLRILNAIRQIIRAVDIDSRKMAVQHHVTGPQLMCLMAVVENGSITSTDVARRVHLDSSTLVGVLDRLEKKGLIRRERSHEDRRQVHLTATETGRKLAAKTPFPMQHALGREAQEHFRERTRANRKVHGAAGQPDRR